MIETATVTLPELRKALALHGKPVSTMTVYRYLAALGIRQTVRQRPARYPGITSKMLLAHLGLIAPIPWPASRLPTAAELKAERRKGKARR